MFKESLLKKLETDKVPKQVRSITQQMLERAVIIPIVLDTEALEFVYVYLLFFLKLKTNMKYLFLYNFYLL